MDHQTKVEDLKEQVKAFCEARDWDQFHGPKELAIGISTEAAELLQHFRFKSEDQIREMLNTPEKRKEINEELADVLYFVLRMAQMYNIDLTTELTNKIEKNDKRYPVDKSKGQNMKYTEL